MKKTWGGSKQSGFNSLKQWFKKRSDLSGREWNASISEKYFSSTSEKAGMEQ
jgi:hypothetical protein